MSNAPNISEHSAVTLRPHGLQWLIDTLPWLLLNIASYFYAGMEDMPLTTLVAVIAILLSLDLIYNLVYLQSFRYHINQQQLILTYGVFNSQRQYLELYRIMDYYEHQSIMQRLFGLKTVTLYSTDKSMPILNIFGIKIGYDIVAWLRPRVEYNRRRMGVYEFANQ